MWSRCDEASIASLLDIVMDITLNVVAIWERNPCFYPSYATYLGGFVQARAPLQRNSSSNSITSRRSNQGAPLPYESRIERNQVQGYLG